MKHIKYVLASVCLLVMAVALGCEEPSKKTSQPVIATVYHLWDASNGMTNTEVVEIVKTDLGDIHFKDPEGRWYSTNGYTIKWKGTPKF